MITLKGILCFAEPPGLGFNFTREYMVFENSTRVELPCTVMKGQPHPIIKWFTTNMVSSKQLYTILTHY